MTARGDLTSANTVGYTTINLEEGKWYMVVPQFTKTGVAEGDTFNALDVMSFSGLNAGTFNTRDAQAPQIQVHRPSDDGYDKYYYISDSKDAGKNVTSWTTGRAAGTGITVCKYRGFWFKATGVSDGATITVAGEVRSMTEPIAVEVGTDGEWQIISNPYPCDLYLENISVEGLTPGTFNTRDAVAPQMQVHRPSDDGYDKYYYISDSKDAGKNVTSWTTGRAAMLSGKICDAGKGFWLKVPSGTGKLIFKIGSAE